MKSGPAMRVPLSWKDKPRRWSDLNEFQTGALQLGTVLVRFDRVSWKNMMCDSRHCRKNSWSYDSCASDMVSLYVSLWWVLMKKCPFITRMSSHNSISIWSKASLWTFIFYVTFPDRKRVRAPKQQRASTFCFNQHLKQPLVFVSASSLLLCIATVYLLWMSSTWNN